MYGLPKVHEDGTPLSPIQASTGSFNHECAKWLSDILSPLRSHSTNLKDTFSFIDKVKNLSLNDSGMYSFDVVSLFTYISLHFTLQLILDTIFKDNIETFHNLNKWRLKTLLNWTVSSTTLQFQGKYYKQVDGIAMGSSLAPMLANVIKNYVTEVSQTALVRLPEICLHDSTNTTPAPKNVKTKMLPTISMKISTIKLTLQNLKYLELPGNELISLF